MRPALFLARAACAFPLLLQGCIEDRNLAGVSSGVDNPQIVVAFTDSSGSPAIATGSVSIYLADQNPALNPDPVAQIRVENTDSVRFSRLDFLQGKDTGGVRRYNVLLMGDDSLAGLLGNLAYDPSSRKFSFGDSDVTRTRLALSRRVRYQSLLDQAADSGLKRVFIPGSPFQTVVVESSFTFEDIPQGVFPLRMITEAGLELPLPDSLNTLKPQTCRVDTTVPPIDRPPPPPPPPLTVDAGSDKNVFLGVETFLVGHVSGVDDKDPRLALLWRQISPVPKDPRDSIWNPSALKTRVSFSKAGAYRFVLSAVYGADLRVEDTVLMGVQQVSQPAFIQPVAGDTVFLGEPFEVVWNGIKQETLSLQVSLNGESWDPVPGSGAIPGKTGLNSRAWTPSGPASNNCRLRLVDPGNREVARSEWFILRARSL